MVITARQAKDEQREMKLSKQVILNSYAYFHVVQVRVSVGTAQHLAPRRSSTIWYCSIEAMLAIVAFSWVPVSRNKAQSDWNKPRSRLWGSIAHMFAMMLCSYKLDSTREGGWENFKTQRKLQSNNQLLSQSQLLRVARNKNKLCIDRTSHWQLSVTLVSISHQQLFLDTVVNLLMFGVSPRSFLFGCQLTNSHPPDSVASSPNISIVPL